MADNKETTILIQIAGQLGAVASQLEHNSQDLKDFKQKYDQNAIAARDHANKMELELEQKVGREEIKPLMTINSIIKSWVGIGIIFAIMMALGFIAAGPAMLKFLEAKKQLNEILEPATPSKGKK